MWVWRSREIPDLVGEFDPDAIIAEAAGRPFIIEYLTGSNFPTHNLRATFFNSRYPHARGYEVKDLGFYHTSSYGEDIPVYEDDQGVVHFDGFIQDYSEAWEQIENTPAAKIVYADEEELIERFFAHNNIDHYGDEYYNIPILITFATEPKPPASINRWYLQKHLG